MWKSLPYAGAWLAATATSVTVGVAAVRFVVHTTAPSLALVTAPESYSPVPAPPVATPTRGRPAPTASAGPTSPSSPRHTPSHGGRPSAPPPSSDPGLIDTVAICADESGDIESDQAKGGLVAVRFTPSGVCLISALPRLGFDVETAQPAAGTVVVTFTSAHRRSVVTASTSPAPHFDTQES
ncbi:MAG: hypothetical protein ACJ73S_06370 [Mycobacteriales bacterium]